ncbi:MAG: L-ribulose-5-phosphate 3-epimerase [Eubacteriaceae bacterium]|nr:L-ribulose-5-phosphate 3-epimerase [Eubacteriaceae bacterium]
MNNSNYKYSLGLYEKAFPDELSLKEKMLLAKEIGYDFLEICIDLNPERELRLDWTKTQRKELIDFMFDHDISLRTISLSLLRKYPLGMIHRDMNKLSLEILEKGLNFASDLGAKIVLINGYDVFNEPSTPETSNRFMENITKAAALAAEKGIILGIENAEKEFMNTVKKCAYWVEKIGSPFFCIYGDVANTAIVFNGDPDKCIADFEEGRGKIAAMHLKDSINGDYRFTDYGKGQVDFKRSIDKLKSMGVGIFNAELFYSPDSDYRTKAKQVHDFLRSFF